MKGNGKCCPVTLVAKILLIIGGLNWGLIAIDPTWNVVSMLFGDWPVVVQVVYGLVGISAIWVLIKLFTGCKSK